MTESGERVQRVWRAWADFTSDDIDAVSRWQADAIDRCEDYGLNFEGGEIGPAEEDEATVSSRAPATKKLASDFGFADFWSVYPRRNGRLVGKAKTLERWSKFDLDTRRLAVRAAKKYARACNASTTIAKDPERFLLKDYWRDWLEDAIEEAERPRGVPDNATFDPITKTWVVH
jgi:hypothetical protein